MVVYMDDRIKCSIMTSTKMTALDYKCFRAILDAAMLRRGVWIFILILFAITGTSPLSNDILGLDIPVDPKLDANTVCKSYPGLTPAQYAICSQSPEVAAAAIQGLQLAIHECQHQLSGHRWNCTSLETRNRNPHSNPIMGKGFRETAFAYALLAAGMVTQISHACSMGKLPVCGCVPKMNMDTGEWQWHGCEDNIRFAHNFATDFLDAKENAKDLHSHMNLHNNKAGRLIVRGRTNVQCKCHGMSGSCEMKTCWKVAPPFREVGDIIKQKFDKATKVANRNKVRTILSTLRKKKILKRRDLVYFEKSPTFCSHDPDVDSPGTRGRICTPGKTGSDGCKTLCCGRGYKKRKITRTERCNCKFHWCCYVICQECSKTEWVTVCK